MSEIWSEQTEREEKATPAEYPVSYYRYWELPAESPVSSEQQFLEERKRRLRRSIYGPDVDFA